MIMKFSSSQDTILNKAMLQRIQSDPRGPALS